MTDGPIRVAHPDGGFSGDICGCCEGTTLATLQPIENRPNLTAVAFRVGDHGSFKASMLTNLASSAYPALSKLRTREDDDFSIALIDAWASVCDILTFYQERLANEAYIGTATERLSIGELARLIGYRLHPGAAAETDLVLLMEDPPGAEADVTDLSVPTGTRVQSQPGPDETAQVFETIEALDARVAWNALRPRLSRDILPADGDTVVWVAGTAALQQGDALLFLTRERWDEDFSGYNADTLLHDFRRVAKVEPAADASRTRVTLADALDSIDSGAGAPTPGLRLFHLRDRAGLFGFNAPHPLSLSEDQRANYGFDDSSGTDTSDWNFALPDTGVQLDNVYKTFVPGSWAVLTSTFNLSKPYLVTSSDDDSLAQYAISGKAQRLDFDTQSDLQFYENNYRRVAVYGGSTEIALAEAPVETWVAGDEIELDSLAADLPEDRKLILRGKAAMLQIVGQSIVLTHDDGAVRLLTRGAVVTLLDEPEAIAGDYRYRLMDETGFIGTADVAEDTFRIAAPPRDADEIVVAATLKQVIAADATHSTLKLTEPLDVAFDRSSLTIHANVARAAHGEGVTQILGHGDPSQPFQKFALQQAPVTHRLAPTETGVESTLSVRIDGVEWEEVPDLYQRGATSRVYRTSLTDDGHTIVEFGDGISGARPPAGHDNIVAHHSRGLGAEGNLRAGQLKLPLDRPLGLKETANPIPATGGAAPEKAADARRNAPIYTLTLGRVVSLTDYRDFALGYPGIAKAEARWVWQGETRRIVVTVAGDDGAEVLPDTTTYDNLLGAFRELGDPLVGVDLLSYDPATFRLGLRVKPDEAYDPATVLTDTEARLREVFSFDNRGFAEVLNLSEVAAAAHQVPGVLAVDIDQFYRTEPPQTSVVAHARLISQTGRLGDDGTLQAAEILTLNPGPLYKIEVMA